MEGTFENTGLVVCMHINDWAKFYQPSPKGSGKHHGTHPSAESEAVRNVIQVI